MKTNFESEEDINALNFCLESQIMDSKKILFGNSFDDVSNKNFPSEYWLNMLHIRRKCFEFLGREDPNKDYLDKTEKEIGK